MDEPVIRTEGLTKRYGATTAVDQLDLEVQPGEIFGLLGPNGAGKTTTVLMLLGLSEPTAGTARVAGLDPARQSLEVKRKVGYLPDSVGFYEQLTGRQNLAFVARLNGIPVDEATERVDALLKQVGLADAADRPTGGYSRGMLQRLGIADALVKDPEVLILDEPTIAIDPAGVSDILALIERLRDEHGVTVLLSSHLLHQVQRICDRVAIFVGGRIVAQGTVHELADELAGGHQQIEVAADGDPQAIRTLLAELPDVERVEADDGLLLVTATGDVRGQIAERLVDAGLALTHLRQRGSELDDIYRRYFTSHQEEGARGDH